MPFFSAILASAGRLWLALSLLTLPIHADDEQRLQQQFESKIKPLLQQKCGECHWGAEANAGLGFDVFSTVEQVLDADRRWATVARELTNQSMPPEDAEPLTQDERELLLQWIDQTSRLIDCSNIYPGNVTIRRLNAIEYRNSVRDLLGVDYSPAADFPGDDVGYGFDNIADVISLPPILLEKYLDAAESIASQAIVDSDNPPLNVSLSGMTFLGENEFTISDDGLLAMYTTDTAAKKVRFPVIGRYSVEVVAYGDQAGTEAVRMSLMLDSQLIDTVDVTSRSGKPSTHAFSIRTSGSDEHSLQIRFENDVVINNGAERQDRNLYVMQVRLRGPLPIDSPDGPERSWLAMSGEDEVAEAATFVNEFISRAFRRPLDESDRVKFMSLFAAMRNDGQTFHDSMRGVTQAVLVSPEFLYRIEQPVEDRIRDLDSYELATALSYFLWSSTPDDELLSLAAAKELAEPEVLDRQATRLLASPRSAALVDNFAAQWLNLRLLDQLQPDPDRFPGVDSALLSDMRSETRLVVTDIFRRDASILELLNSRFTFLNERLAEHYQLDFAGTAEFQKVVLKGSGRSGLLTHASILTLTSNPDRTSPVKRGKWIMENILGDEPPPPPPGVDPLDDQVELTGTLRERTLQHRADPSCASCHETMDSLGFALENFDAVGRFRLMDEDLEIDVVSELPDGTRLDGASGLQQHLGTTYRDKFVRCFTEKLLIYALGRGLRYYDRCTVERIMKQAESENFRLSAFVKGIVQSETFRRRSPHASQPSQTNVKGKS